MAGSISRQTANSCFSASIWARNPIAKIGTARCLLYGRWTFDLDSQRAVRLTPKKLFGWDGCWINSDNILFLSRAPGEKENSIYRMSTNGKDLKRLIRDARFPTVSAL